jgi:hypothetical protein
MGMWDLDPCRLEGIDDGDTEGLEMTKVSGQNGQIVMNSGHENGGSGCDRRTDLSRRR